MVGWLTFEIELLIGREEGSHHCGYAEQGRRTYENLISIHLY